jgi:hypothetical protein
MSTTMSSAQQRRFVAAYLIRTMTLEGISPLPGLDELAAMMANICGGSDNACTSISSGGGAVVVPPASVLPDYLKPLLLCPPLLMNEGWKVGAGEESASGGLTCSLPSHTPARSMAGWLSQLQGSTEAEASTLSEAAAHQTARLAWLVEVAEYMRLSALRYTSLSHLHCECL